MSDLARDSSAEYTFEEHEHRELARGIGRIHDVAVAAGKLAAPELSIALLGVLDWVDAVLAPHSAWEDSWLYPEIDRRAGTPWATKLMTFEHHQIREIARRLAADRVRYHHDPTHVLAVELGGQLFALEALVRAHVEREELFLIPLLDGAVASRP